MPPGGAMADFFCGDGAACDMNRYEPVKKNEDIALDKCFFDYFCGLKPTGCHHTTGNNLIYNQ